MDILHSKREGELSFRHAYRLERSNQADRIATKFRGYGSEPGIRVVARQTKWHYRNTSDVGIVLRQVFNRLQQNFAIVNSWTKYNLSMNFNTGGQQPVHLIADVRAIFIYA